MSILQIALLVGTLNFVAIILGLYAFSQKRVDLERRLKRQETAEKTTATGMRQAVQRLEQVMRPIGEMLPRSPEEMSRQEKKLVQAGFRRKDAVVLFYGAQLGIAGLLLLAFLITGHLYQHPVVFLLVSALGGAAIPDMWLKQRMDARKEKLRNGLPDAMDLTIVAMEAGLGLDQALLRVGDEIRVAYPELSEELHLRNLEVNMGRSRAQALRNLAQRTAVEDLSALVAILVQTDRFGTSVGTALRVFSDTMRTKRRQRAEEQAAKLPVKMIVPMVIFIFPSLLVLIVGPAFIQILNVIVPAFTGKH
jgi:tight adherence protein C